MNVILKTRMFQDIMKVSSINKTIRNKIKDCSHYVQTTTKMLIKFFNNKFNNLLFLTNYFYIMKN
jgi:hypothetical protein